MSLKSRMTILTAAVAATIVIALLIVQLNNLVESYVASSLETADLAGQQIKHSLIVRLQEQEKREAAQGRNQSLSELLRSDHGFALLLESTMAETHSLVEISVAGQDGTVIASSNPLRPGTAMQKYPDLSQLQRTSSLRRLAGVLRYNTDHEIRIPLGFSNQIQPVFTIQVLASSVLLREQLMPALRRVAEWGAAALLLSAILAWLSARLVTRNLDVISNTIDRIRSGQMPTQQQAAGSSPTEFAAIESKLNLLGLQVRGAAELKGVVENLLGRMEEAILLFDAGQRLTLTGGALGSVLGLSGAQVMGRSLQDIFPPHTPLGRALGMACSERRQLRNETFGWHADGIDRRLIVNLEFSAHGSNQDLGTAMLRVRDAAGHHELEEHLGTSMKTDAMNRVTGSVAHEIKNPLNSIAIRLDNLQAWATNKFPEAEKEILHIFEEVNRLDRVVRTFLDFTRPVTLSMQKVDVVALAQHVTEMMMPDAARRNVEARFSSEREALFVEGDRDRLEQAIINLVANGIEAMPEGGSLTVEVEKSGGECAIVVSDTGVGIPEAAREKVFDLYFTTKKNGSGLGLPMAFQTIQLHGGTIDVDSKPGEGTTFHVRLPLISENGRGKK
jgi:signal transduction histidine kinase/HAMP domain-containing protein